MRQKLSGGIACFIREKKGGIALTFGLAAVPLTFATGAAFDYAIMVQQKGMLQEAADAAALAATKEMSVSSIGDSVIQDVAKRYVESTLGATEEKDKNGISVAVKTEVQPNNSGVKVMVSYYWKPFMLHHVTKKALPIDVSATASLAGEASVCVIALDNTDADSLTMSGASSIQANGCAIYSNSSHYRGVSTVAGSSLSSIATYSSGGYSGPVDTFKPTPIIDSPIIVDPLKDRPAPIVGTCLETNLSINKGNVTLKPGTYCGGITLKGKTLVTLEPGDYIIKDGPLSVGGNSTLNGDDVGFYFQGSDATFDFGVSTQASLGARKSGPMSGILFFEDRTATNDREFVIRSKDAERFEGTVYLPRGKLIVDKASKVGQQSKWTAIIANKVEIKKGPQLEINSDYANSDIPVPAGIGPTGNMVGLVN